MKKSLSFLGLLILIILSFTQVEVYAAINIPTLHCAGNQNTYTVDPISNTHHYIWTITDPGVTGWSPSSTTTSSTVTWLNVIAGSGSATMTVRAYTSLNLLLQTVARPIASVTIPSAPTSVTLPAYHCIGTSATYTVEQVPCASSYNWSVTGAGWSIANTFTDAVELIAGSSSATISVRATNGFGNSAWYNRSTVTPITIPPVPGVVTEPATHCAKTTGTYYISPVAGSDSYIWNAFGADWSVSGSSSTVTIYAGDASGTITVRSSNVCGASSPRTFIVTPLVAPDLPVPPITGLGESYHCQGSARRYTIAPVVGATSYTWTVTGSGWSTSSSSSTYNDITAGPIPATISVYANYSCGQSLPVTLLVTPIRHATISNPISGPALHCVSTAASYSVTPPPDAGYYTWTIYGTGWSGSSTMSTINITSGPSSGTITAQAHNICGPGNVVTKVVTPISILSPPTSISGPAYHCVGSSATYSINPVTGADSYTWSVTGTGWFGTSLGTNYVVSTGPNSGTITVRANNYCGSSTKTVKIVQPLYTPVTPAINSPAVQCAFTSNTYTVASDPTVTSYTWTVTGVGWTHGDSTKSWFPVTASASSATITVIARNQCGNGQRVLVNITPIRIPAKPAQIYTPSRHCIGTAVPYAVSQVSGATSYTWRVYGNGWSGTSSTAFITITAGTGSALITVTANTACGSSDTVQTTMSSSSVPSQPAVIDTPLYHCQSTIKTYSIPDVNGATNYTWSLANKTGAITQWSITSPATTTSVEVFSGSESATITVIAYNSCGAGVARKLILNPDKVPTAPTAVTAPSQHCIGTVKTYRATPVAGATSYTWTLAPSGWTSNNSTSDTINITAGTGNATLTVKANNLCGAGPVKSVTIISNNVPPQPTGITLANAHCETTIKYYKVVRVTGALSYVWSVSGTGWSIFNPSNVDSVAIIAGTGTANISCSAVNACGTGPAVTTVASSLPLPTSAFGLNKDTVMQTENATITYHGNAPANATYTWNFAGGTAIPGTGQGPHFVTWSTIGLKTISLIVTQNGCGSQQSLVSIVVKQYVGVDNNKDGDVNVAIQPNPNTGNFTLRIDNAPNMEVNMRIINAIGQEVYGEKLTTTDEGFTKEFNLNTISSGVYFLKLRFNDREIVKQIMITK